MNAPSTPATNGKPSRNRVLAILAAVFIVALVGYGVWYYLVGSHYESTDDAYVAGNVVQITPQIAGTVVSIKVDDTEIVKAGQDLVMLDKADAQVALDQAEAQLAQTVREVRNLYANNATLESNIDARNDEVARNRSEVERAADDYQRRQALLASGAVSSEELKHVENTLIAARSNLAGAEAALVASREQLAANRTLTDGTSVEQHPSVLRAAARVREAYLAVARSSIVAPVNGQIAKRTVQVGQRVAPGTPLMAIVPLDYLWVDANFKEVQLRSMKTGQPVTLEADLYGGKVEYRGHIVGLAAGTGGAFSLLPAQNATGNWIKVVQRLPVRIAIEPADLRDHPLRVGLSMVAKVKVDDQSGAPLAVSNSGEQSDAIVAVAEEAGPIIERIIKANLGSGAKLEVTAPIHSVVHPHAATAAR